MHWFTAHVFTPYPELLIMITVAIGFLIGKLHYKSIGLGAVTGCLVAGLFTGWVTKVPIDATVKAVFFDLFLFALGYKVGPQFFRGLKKDGLPQVAVTVVMCVTGLLVCWGFAELANYSVGLGAGLLGGALTQSAVIGVAQQAISTLPGLSAAQITTEQNLVPVAYAVTYPLGTILCAMLLANFAPRWFSKKSLAEECAILARELDAPEGNPDVGEGYAEVVLRAYELAGQAIAGMSIEGLCLFVTVVGINAGPTFTSGLSQAGAMLLVWGAIATVIPLIVGLYMGHYVFKIRLPILLGVVAGGQTTTAAIGAIDEAGKSTVPTLGYTVPYAVANVLLTIWGSIIVVMLH